MGVKVPDEAKKKAIQAALDGNDPYEYLRPYTENPKAMWSYIKTMVKKKDPDLYAKIPDLRNREKVKEDLQRAISQVPVYDDDLEGSMVTAINVQPYGEFYHDVHHNCIDWRAPDGDEMTMDLVGWKNLSRDLPKILKKLGVVL